MDISKIEGTLSDGNIYPKSVIKLFYFLMYLMWFVLILPIFMIIVSCFVPVDNIIDILMLLMLSLISNIIISTMSLWIIIRNKKIQRKVKLCLEDAIVVKGVTKKLDEVFFVKHAVKILVRFKIGEKRYVRISSCKHSELDGCNKVFNKYADQVIDILYSPKYDEVLIIKKGKN